MWEVGLVICVLADPPSDSYIPSSVRTTGVDIFKWFSPNISQDIWEHDIEFPEAFTGGSDHCRLGEVEVGKKKNPNLWVASSVPHLSL